MKGVNFYLIRSLVVMFALICFHQTGFARETLMQPVNLRDDVMEVQQVIFDFEAGTVRDTDWGRVQFNPEALARSTGMASGYYNMFVHTREGSGSIRWVVQNLYLPGQLSSQSIPMSVYIDLRPDIEGSGPVGSITVNVVASESALPVTEEIQDIAGSFGVSEITVSTGIINAEGAADGIAGIPVPGGDLPNMVGPPPLSPLPVPEPMGDFAPPIAVFQDNMRNIQAGVNQCIPAAYANTFQYLEDRYNKLPPVWNIPHAFIPGYGLETVGEPSTWSPVPSNSLVANIDALTRRPGVSGWNSGSGAMPCPMIRGAFGYMATLNFADVNFRHQGGDPMPEFLVVGDGGYCKPHPNAPFNGLVSFQEGLNVTWDWMYDQLKEGRGIVISFVRYNPLGNSMSGHAVRVWGAMRVGGKEYIYTLDDSKQGNNNVGIRVQQWEVDDKKSPGDPFNSNGRLELGKSTWEIISAFSVEANPI